MVYKDMPSQNANGGSPESQISNKPSWIDQTKAAAEAESRWQPWKKTLETVKVDTGFEGEDKMKTRSDDDVQHSGVAA